MRDTFEYNLNLSDINISIEQVIRGMGYIDQKAPDYLYPLVSEYLDRTQRYLKLVVGYRLFSSGLEIDPRKIVIDNVELHAQKIITRHLKGATSVAVFAASAGIEFDYWIRSFYESNDQLNGYVVDTIGSEIVESAGDWLESKLQQSVDPKVCSNRLSPGYCNWSVEDQHRLFSLLPQDFCGITLSSSALMKPIKSISGIIGIGMQVKRMDYQCNICSLENCYKRIRDIRQTEG